MKPPSGGPTTGPISAGMVSQASASTMSAFGAERSSTSRPTGTIIAPPRPWNTRAAISVGSECEAPHRIEPRVKTTIAARNTRARAEPVGDPAGGGNEHRQRQQVGGQRELQRDRILVEVARDRGQRGRQHRAVHVLHEQRGGDDEGGENRGAHGNEETAGLVAPGGARGKRGGVTKG